MSLSLLATSTVPSSSLLNVNPLRSNTKNRSTVRVGKKVAYTSCEQKQSNEGDSHTIDRRNVLLGLGGLYGASATIGSQGKIAMGAPVAPPDLSKCQLATDAANGEQVYCCPPYSSADIKPFVPPNDGILRKRKPAHKLNRKEIEDFKRGIQLMKELPETDPWSYYQQATIHCTYCNGAFDQVGFEDVLLQIHGSWLFTPWHRYYIYFWEKILGKLLKDPTFAIPYWSWDTPEGMYMPGMYLDRNSPLYDDNRNHNHFTALMDYDFTWGAPNPTPEQEEEVKIRNLKKIHNMFTETIGAPSLFLGGPLSAGQVPQDIAGALENQHGLPHQWTGPEAIPRHDMGNFYTAARDTMFFGHHANVDRLWDIYSDLRGNKVRDCLITENLGYTYTTERHAWKDIKRTYKKLQRGKKRSAGEGLSLIPVSEFGSAPRALNSTIRVLVPRPKVSRSTDEKEEFSEVVVVEGIKFGHGESTKFDVYIAKPIEGLVGPDLGELAGSFVRVTHTHHKKDKVETTSKIELGVTNLLDDIEAEASDSLVVSLVPQHGDVTIGGVRIDLFASDI
ncbi:hypothetical protein AQUCO_05400047v1 [Aquilegia coerulea]|uniref:Tyrosinase copper-binding domain-containing protein n=1 Tax=Aquilegia coerulea TaxID=218851 RepID=A0A2G5CHA6_AQUCA|nr:hypothetical protein AQUCO_05400047v1 [Aquilegia coerulea]